MSITTTVRQSVCAAHSALFVINGFSGVDARSPSFMRLPRGTYVRLSTGGKSVSETETNGVVTAPPVFHEALNALYQWMAETNSPDGLTTIRAKDPVTDEPGALCADLSIIIYYERPEGDEASGEAGSDAAS
jgi:hypothetical protein